MKKTPGSKAKSSPSKLTKQTDFFLPTPTVADDILRNVRPTPMLANNLTDKEKVESIAKSFKDIMTTLGLDLSNDSLKETPNRLAKMYVHEIFRGLNPEHFPKITVIENEMQYDQMVLVQDVKVLSVCEHHFQTIDGFATVAYIPNRKVVGLSKINRIVDFFSRRPQVQERLTKQVADCLQYVLETEHVAVHISAKHFCVMARGIQDHHSITATSDLRGHFKTKPDTREEFLLHCRTKAKD